MLEKLLEPLMHEGVEFLIVGGQAVAFHGHPHVTYDVDLCYRRTPENLEKLARALAALKPTLRGAPPDLPFRLDGASRSGASLIPIGTSGTARISGFSSCIWPRTLLG
jgi:hypothetical protein